MMDKDKTGIRSLTIEKSNNISDDKIGKPIRLKFDGESLTFSLALENVASNLKDYVTPKAAENNEKKSAKISPAEKPGKNGNKCKPGRKLDKDLVRFAIELSKAGYTLEFIGEVVGKNKATICRWLKKYGS